ncbi:MAG TPA: GNAT family protein [Homoserinimonas sp.]|nr:GNAT family protein [Homoserinimonas sp.]
MVELTLPIETERLVLRAFSVADTDAYFEYQQLPEVARYLYRAPHTHEKCREVLERAATLAFDADGDVLALASESADDATLLGEAVLKLANRAADQGEVGYTLAPWASGRGYATEAAGAMLKLGFETYGFHRIFARIDEENTGSVRVAERLGMRQEARLVESDLRDGQWGTEVVYAMLASEWFGSAGKTALA